MKSLATLAAFIKKISLILIPAFYKVSFLFNLIFKKDIVILKVYNLVNLLLIMFFIVTVVVSLNLYKQLK